MSGHYFLSIEVAPNKWEEFDVPKEVSVYVKQLELRLKYNKDNPWESDCKPVEEVFAREYRAKWPEEEWQ